jgi:hypothetical protein
MSTIGTENGAKGDRAVASLSSSSSSGVPGVTQLRGRSPAPGHEGLLGVADAFGPSSGSNGGTIGSGRTAAFREDIARVTVVTKTGRSVQRRLGKEYGPHGYRS